MSSFSELTATVGCDGAPSRIVVSPDWLQGRTAHGGLTAALCVEAALQCVPGLPPLRAAQFVFIAPATGTLTLTPTVLRAGRSATFVGADAAGEAGLAVRATLVFGASRASALNYSALPFPPVPRPDDCPAYFQPGLAPGFAVQFDTRLAGGARPMTPGAEPALQVWVRHSDPAAARSIAGLVALADAVPPPAFILYAAPAPFSTAAWSLDVLDPAPASEDGWWLVESRAETAADGYSSQAMTIWTSAGRPAMAARQTVAVFA